MPEKGTEYIVIIGAGVIGLTSAYELLKRGYKVTVLEKESTVAMGTSHANGAQLSYTFVDAMASLNLIKKIPSVLAGQDPALKFQWQSSIKLNVWGARFLYNGLPFNEEKNSENLFRLSLYSKKAMDRIQSETGVEFDFRPCGKLVVYESQAALDSAKESVERKANWGYQQHTLSASECVTKEPALKAISANLAGGLYSDIDDIGDAESFCYSMLKYLNEHEKFSINLGCEVTGLDVEQNTITTVNTTLGDISVDKVVMAAGHASDALLKPLGVSLSIYPVKGYSLTFPAIETSPDVSITDISNKFVLGRIGNKVRVAGFADFVQSSPQNTLDRVEELLEVCRSRFPDAADYDTILEKWEGSRPCTPSSMPIIDRVGASNLFANTGHGMYGWTLAAGSACLLADRISEGTLWQQYGGTSCQEHSVFNRK
ncbi:FAD-dependent oxidoreductase [Vibrio penaeicida]|uniref:D-amino-acid dehydrogenase n=1 Tax=Vibrio penaeicida TaxID=104609 RepID=A0AAV5NQL8_9VIBR|nr:FAD-dependent oxidoreductase [Vibrio penaeicida]RTZ20570.1 FAD-dependent oxidoreductase [Vibrio penaeicida]GLQ72552.1 D-amino-acid dehydrogenase [Vibrio penaeicida]